MDKNKNYLELKEFAVNQGADLFGVADISGIKDSFLLSPKILNKFDKAICIGIRLSESVLEEMEGGPTRLYSYHYRAVNLLLDQLALRVNNLIQSKGYSALPVPTTQILDWQKQSAHLSHKRLGVLAGLGWIGRNNLLVNKELGSQLRLVSVLTDMPLKLDSPEQNDCKSCFLCVTMCPAGAIKDKPEDFDHLKCFEKLKGFQKQRLCEQYICGVCMQACRGKK